MLSGLIFYVGMFLSLCVGSYVSFNNTLKSSWYGFFGILLSSLLYSSFWYYGCRKLTTTKDVVELSLIVDCFMVVAYYIIPLVLSGKDINPQTWMAGCVVIAGLFWMKMV